MYKIAICDDETMYRRKLKSYLLQEKSLSSKMEIFEYTDGKELIEDVKKCHDLIFLDIQMKEMDGHETARVLRNMNKDAVLVFCTNYHRLTPETVKVQPFRYIIKDIDDCILKNELPVIIDEMLQKVHPQTLAIIGDGYLHQVEVKDILYIAVKKRGTQVFVYDGRKINIFPCKESLDEMYLIAKASGFEYAHNSYIVNLANIIKLSKNVLTLKGNIELNISRSKRKNFDERFIEFLHMRYKRK